MRHIVWLALACALAAPDTRAAPLRPYTIEDVLSLEKVGRAVFVDGGRHLLFEVQRPWKEAGRFDLDAWTPQRTSRLFMVDVAAGGAPTPILASEAGVGETLGAASPDGRRLIVFRLRDHDRELGVVDVASGSVGWSGLTIEAESWAAQARWRNDREIVALATTSGAPSLQLGRVWQHKARVVASWAAMDRGERSVSVVRGGPGAATNPPWPSVDLVAFDVETRVVRHLARDAFTDFALAPGAATAALIVNAEPVSISAASPVENYAADRRRRLVLVDLDSGRQTRPCPGCDLLGQLKSWSPDGRSLIVCARPDDEAGDWRRYRYWRIALNGTAKRLSGDLAPDQVRQEGGGTTARLVADAGWLGATPAILGRASGGGLAWWRIGPRAPGTVLADLPAGSGARLAAFGAGFVVRTPGGLVALDERGQRNVADKAAVVASSPPMAGDLADSLRIVRPDRADILSPDGAMRRSATLPAGASPLAISPASGAVFSVLRSAAGVSALVLSERDRPPRTLVTLNAGLAEVDAAPPRPVVHQTPKGQTVTSWLYLPAGHTARDARPMIVVPYPGTAYPAPPPANAPDVLTLAANVRAMVGAGYAVLVPSLPMARDAEPGDGLAQSMLAAVDAAQAQAPGLSRSRLAVWGQSFGGFGALTAATQSPRFKAVIASSGASDMFSKYGAQGARALIVPEVWLQTSNLYGWSENGQGRLGGPPWANVDRYVRASPLLHADKVTAPVLLIQGDLDGASGQAEEMFSALYRQGKPVELRYYLGEGHVILSPANVRDVYQSAFRFLQAALSTDDTPGAGEASAAGSGRDSQ